MGNVKVDYNKTTKEYFATCSGYYIKSKDYGPVCREVNRLGHTAKPTGNAIRAKRRQIDGDD